MEPRYKDGILFGVDFEDGHKLHTAATSLEGRALDLDNPFQLRLYAEMKQILSRYPDAFEPLAKGYVPQVYKNISGVEGMEDRINYYAVEMFPPKPDMPIPWNKIG